MSDDTINILGFMPLGIVCYAFLSKAGTRRRLQSALTTILLGAFFSLLIELLQFYLPSRDSSLEDVINNILGTAMGVVVLHLFFLVSRTAKFQKYLWANEISSE